jgi:predicted porin
MSRTTFSNTTPTKIRLKTTSLSATAPAGAGNFLLEWVRTEGSSTSVADYERQTLGLGYDHFLSKRTDLYAVVLHDKVTSLASGTGLALGIRHRF